MSESNLTRPLSLITSQADVWDADGEVDVDRAIRCADRYERNRRRAREILGDLSKCSIGQLGCLYDACNNAMAAWNGAELAPRAYWGDDRDDGGHPEHGAGVAAVMSREYARLYDLMKEIVEEIRHRELAKDDALEVVKILADWSWHSGGDDDLRDVILALLARTAPLADGRSVQ